MELHSCPFWAAKLRQIGEKIFSISITTAESPLRAAPTICPATKEFERIDTLFHCLRRTPKREEPRKSSATQSLRSSTHRETRKCPYRSLSQKTSLESSNRKMGECLRGKGDLCSHRCEVLAGALEDELDAAAILTGDSDFAPVYRCFAEHFPEKKLLFAFSFSRASKELKQLCPKAFSIRKETYAKFQLPDEIKLPSGKFVTIPEAWKRNVNDA
jgi:hypothetical protein